MPELYFKKKNYENSFLIECKGKHIWCLEKILLLIQWQIIIG